MSELVIEAVKRDEEAEFLARMREHHYLGAPYKIGESAFYGAVLQGRWVALSSFYAAALKSRVRDEWLGWHRRDRIARLHLITNQSRFVVLESIPNLASRTLSLLARQVVRDWPLQKNARQLLAGAHLDSHYYRNGVCHKMYGGEDYRTLLDYFSAIEDPRKARGQRYRLETLLAIAAAATLSGARGYQEIGEWVQKQSDAVLKYFKVGKRRGKLQRPSVYCIRNVLVQIDPEQFDAALRNWCISIDGTDAAIAIDGKTLRSAIDENGRQLHVLGASGHRTRMPLGKKNETEAKFHRKEQIYQ